jgi:hypothetical protein
MLQHFLSRKRYQTEIFYIIYNIKASLPEEIGGKEIGKV